MTSLPRFSVDNPVLVNLLMVTILAGGVYSGLTLVREMFPESRPNQIMVTTAYPGASPAEIEKGITLKIEEQIKNIEGVEKLSSTVTEGGSAILVDLRSGYESVDAAVNDVQSAIDAIPREDFPEDALQTRVTKFEPRFPVMMLSLYGDLDDRSLKTLGDRLRHDLLALREVTNVVLSGTRKDEISIEVRAEKLVAYGLSFLDVAGAVAASNLDLPGGTVRTGRMNISVRTLGEKDRGEDLRNIVLRSDPSGRVVHLSDVATIVDGFEDADVFGRFKGKPAVSATVYKTPDQDAIAIAERVKALVAGKMGQPLRRSWFARLLSGWTGGGELERIHQIARGDPYPAGIALQVHSDLSRIIDDRLNLLERNGVWGLGLVFLSLLVFLHWRISFWVMMGLVLAVTGTLACMKILGLSLNLITMFGLIIVLGLLVDDAIIVSEHYYSKIEAGVEPRLAAITATEEVSWPVVCAVFTTVVAFVPLMFIEGRMGEWMGTLPVIVCVALTASLAEALSILPCHLAHATGRGDGGGRRRLAGGRRAAGRPAGDRTTTRRHRFVAGARDLYERLLRTATAYRYVSIAGLVSCLMIVGAAVGGGHIPYVFIPKIDTEFLIAAVRMAPGAPVEQTQKAVQVIERAALKVPELESLYTLVGMQVGDDGVRKPLQSHLGQAFIELCPADDRDRTSAEIIQALREQTQDIPGVDRLNYTSLEGGPGGAPIHLEIRGKDHHTLIAVADYIKRRLAGFDGVFDLVDDFDAGRPEVQIELFESARALGLTTESLATQVRAAFYGYEARKVQRGREDVKIMVRYPQAYRTSIHDIETMRIATPSGALVPFSEVAALRERTGFATIKRVDQRRTVTVTADVDTAVANADQIIASLSRDFPEIEQRYPGVVLEFGGQKLETKKSFGSLRQNFVIALVLVYVILAGLFRSYVQPLIVMAVIPFGCIGAVLGHLIMGYPITLLSLIGIVALTGIVVNDSMILVVFINQRILRGAPVHEAIIDAGKGRLRPILLTSATTVLGIAPLLMETSFQAKFLIPMGVSLSAGLMFATVLTLVAVPCFYLIVLDMKRVGARLRGWATASDGEPSTAIPAGGDATNREGPRPPRIGGSAQPDELEQPAIPARRVEPLPVVDRSVESGGSAK